MRIILLQLSIKDLFSRFCTLAIDILTIDTSSYMSSLFSIGIENGDFIFDILFFKAILYHFKEIFKDFS
jgi:hypothetical protein